MTENAAAMNTQTRPCAGLELLFMATGVGDDGRLGKAERARGQTRRIGCIMRRVTFKTVPGDQGRGGCSLKRRKIGRLEGQSERREKKEICFSDLWVEFLWKRGHERNYPGQGILYHCYYSVVLSSLATFNVRPADQSLPVFYRPSSSIVCLWTVR